MALARVPYAWPVIPLFGVPEALLSDRGTNLSHLMCDVCALLGIGKLNTMTYHPQCDGLMERFNCTLKSLLRKHAVTFGRQWDRHLPAVLWAYQNVPHESTGEKPSFLLFGIDCRSPTDAVLQHQLNQLIWVTIVRSLWWPFLVLGSWLLVEWRKFRPSSRSITTVTLDPSCTELVTGYWYVILRKRQANKGNCRSPGMAPTGLLQWLRWEWPL